jgi:hypothetical protein
MQTQTFQLPNQKTLDIEYEYPKYLKVFYKGQRILYVDTPGDFDKVLEAEADGELVEIRLNRNGLEVRSKGALLLDVEAETQWAQRAKAAFILSGFCLLMGVVLSFIQKNAEELSLVIGAIIMFAVYGIAGQLMRDKKFAGLVVLVIFLGLNLIFTILEGKVPLLQGLLFAYFAKAWTLHKRLHKNNLHETRNDLLDN